MGNPNGLLVVLTRLRTKLLSVGQWAAVLSLFAVPLNKPATNLLIALALVCAVSGSDLRQRWTAAFKHPVALGALVWWGVLVLSAAHSWVLHGAFPELGSFVWALWYPLVFNTLLLSNAWRQRALMAFAVSVACVVAVSLLQYLDLLPQRAIADAIPAMSNTVFKEYTQQGLAALLLAGMAMAVIYVRSTSLRTKVLLSCTVLLALVSVTLALQSRTAYLTLIPLVLYWCWRWLSRGPVRLSKTTALYLSGALLAIGLVLLASPIPDRLVKGVQEEIAQYETQKTATSTGIRLELWRRTAPIISEAPLLGHGLGQWENRYRESITRDQVDAGFLMGHPHQEVLLILAEQGVIGFAIFAVLMIALARYIWRLPGAYRDVFAGALLVYLTAGLANGLWSDFSHRHVFVLLLACMPLAIPRTTPPSPLHSQGRP